MGGGAAGKKLEGAARRWLSGPGGADYEVLPANLTAVRAFCAASTQWRTGPMGGLAGLDYAGAKAACEGLGIDWSQALPGLRIMEGAALDAQPSS